MALLLLIILSRIFKSQYLTKTSEVSWNKIYEVNHIYFNEINELST